MRILAFLAVALVGCGGGQSQHEVVDCSFPAPNGTFEKCERACTASKVDVNAFDGCDAVNPFGATASGGDTSMRCPRETVKSYGGVTGCCAFDGNPAEDGAVLRFFQCTSDL